MNTFRNINAIVMINGTIFRFKFNFTSLSLLASLISPLQTFYSQLLVKHGGLVQRYYFHHRIAIIVIIIFITCVIADYKMGLVLGKIT